MSSGMVPVQSEEDLHHSLYITWLNFIKKSVS